MENTYVGATEDFSPLRWDGDRVLILDQTRLPLVEEWLDCDDPEQVAAAIRRLSIRGAPAIGVAAAYGLVVGLGVGTELDVDVATLRQRFQSTYELLAATRPTAVNLQWALDLGQQVFDDAVAAGRSPRQVRAELESWAIELQRQDVETNRRIGEVGAALFENGDRVLTHCNAGALATAGYGTAIGVIHSSFDAGKVSMVWVDETRPLLQGARLTSWELDKLGVPYRLVTDNSSGSLMSRDMVDRIVVGADRIAANGDVANKIGTYTVAVLARRHGVPFYVAAPLSTIDRATPTGADIPIEERDASEVVSVFDTRVAPQATEALNIAFDVTPAELVTAIITEQGVLTAPYDDSIAAAFERQGG
jgi:methylthioribose-1-phosphate isomerase